MQALNNLEYSEWIVRTIFGAVWIAVIFCFKFNKI